VKASALAGRVTWTRYWQWMRKYHRYEIARGGIERILRCAGPALIVGYHGKPGARDLVMLQTLLLQDYGERTHAITNDMVFGIPGLRGLAEGMQLVSRDRAAIEKVVRRGEKLVVTPGGIAEGWGAERYRVRWKSLGYLRLAARHNLPIILVAGVGVDEAFLPLYDAYRFWSPAWKGRRGGGKLPEGAGLWLGLGPTGLWPLTPPIPVRIVQYIDPPLYLEDHGIRSADDLEGLARVHRSLAHRTQQMLDEGRDRARARAIQKKELTWLDQVTSR
jgi:hypothetical protein